MIVEEEPKPSLGLDEGGNELVLGCFDDDGFTRIGKKGKPVPGRLPSVTSSDLRTHLIECFEAQALPFLVQSM